MSKENYNVKVCSDEDWDKIWSGGDEPSPINLGPFIYQNKLEEEGKILQARREAAQNPSMTNIDGDGLFMAGLKLLGIFAALGAAKLILMFMENSSGDSE